MRRIPSIRIGPDQSTVLLPERIPACGHIQTLAACAPLGNRNREDG
jgi:hypothetical protein